MMRIAILICSTLVVTTAANAQDPVKWSAKASAPTTGSAPISITLSAEIDDGWHIYSLTQPAGGPIPTTIVVDSGNPFVLAGAIKGDDPDVKFDSNFGINLETHERTADFVVPLQRDSLSKKEARQLRIKVRYQACNATVCLPAKTAKLMVAVPAHGTRKRK